ncbi:MAG TPA: methyltransferase domain-containing protein [Pirellulaceae bacterium]|nr:methyltransferase domain-containing protein [Pirellulaceae bacterium]HMO92738.1 methyltransferase domain-containing protein [Pirellulaceae bacterium]HMP70290.1 methyltransferase domain-containing protein [Pirellulaceae bacterium]
MNTPVNRQSEDVKIDPSVFATPQTVENPKDCSFYHAMTIPGLGEVGREWDLRSNISDYLGNQDFRNKRVLDVGTASGYLTFEMERQGADVVSFDMLSGRQWNLVPHFKLDDERDQLFDRITDGHRRLKNAYWYSHRALGSKAKAFYGDVYNISDKIGKFDIVLFGMILSHLRDPFQALYSGARLSQDTVIVTNQTRNEPGEGAKCYFLPNADDESMNRAWWSFTDTCIEQMLGVLGFQVESKKRQSFKQICVNPPADRVCTVFVARRVARQMNHGPHQSKAA